MRRRRGARPLAARPRVLHHRQHQPRSGEGIGGNLALYSNKTADRLLEEARGTLNPLERAQKYDDFQKVLIEDIPAVFLYSSHYLYGLDDDVGGFDTELIAVPQERFSNVANWYLKTKRVFR